MQGDNFNNNQNNNGFELPKLQTETKVEENKPIIEIPQAYYDKLEAERIQKIKEEEENLKKEEINSVNKMENTKLFLLALVSAFVVFMSYYLTINVNNYILIVLPIYIIFGSLILGIKDKKNSNFPLAFLLGSLLVALICFIVVIVVKKDADIWNYYSITCGISALIGFVISSIINWIVCDYKEIKALQTIGLVIVFGLIIVLPVFIFKKYPEEVYKYLFMKESVIIAETEKDYILKTLKNRYDIKFVCDSDIASLNSYDGNNKNIGKVSKGLNENNRKITVRFCSDMNGKVFKVNSIEYNYNEVLYVVQDEYLNAIHFYELKESLESLILVNTNAVKVNIYFYPKEHCSFIGDCIDCDDYYDRYEKEYDINEQYSYSSTAKFSNDISLTSKDYLNSKEFKYKIVLYNNYANNAETVYVEAIKRLFNILNEGGFKNTYGYEISFVDSSDQLKKELFKVVGDTNSEQIFKEDYKIQKK